MLQILDQRGHQDLQLVRIMRQNWLYFGKQKLKLHVFAHHYFAIDTKDPFFLVGRSVLPVSSFSTKKILIKHESA
jgi:hypothetical protein